MSKIPGISAALAVAFLMGTSSGADETSTQTSVQAGEWQCGTTKNSKTGYQCDVITFRPGFGGNPKVYLSLSKLDLTGAGSDVLESIAVHVAQVSWSGFQPEVDATGWTDNTRAEHIDLHKAGNWAGTWVAVGPPLTNEKH
jgi:hypothetical protein